MVVIVRSGLSLRSVVVPQSISSLVLITRLTRILLEIYELVVIKYRVLTQAIKPKIAEWRDLEALYFFPKLNAPAVFSTSAFESRRLDKNKLLVFRSFSLLSFFISYAHEFIPCNVIRSFSED